MPLLETDYLIIGQGLAGSLLAFELIQRQHKVLVIDNNHVGSSSQVAAGIINPVTGHRLNLTEGFTPNMAKAQETYGQLEKALNCQIYREIDQHRLIKNPGQAEYLKKRLSDPVYNDFLKSTTQKTFKDTRHGVVQVRQTALVDTKRLLESIKRWLKDSESYLSGSIDYTALTPTLTGVSLQGVACQTIEAKYVIFCEGYQAINNPWLKDLPFKLSKGEILTLTNKSQYHTMLSWGRWYVPLTNGLAKLGSNYAWGDLSLNPSTNIKNKLLSSLDENLTLNAELVDHEVGIRPTTQYRQPFIGPISGLENAYCFNGFGSKGCLTIPQHAADLCDFLLNRKPLATEVSKCL